MCYSIDGEIDKALRWIRQTGYSYIDERNISSSDLPYGLIGMMLSRSHAAIAVLACKSDQAATTGEFQQFLGTALRSCLANPDSIQEGWGQLHAVPNHDWTDETTEFKDRTLRECFSLTASILGRIITTNITEFFS